jgi:hypothetical protein
MSRRGQWLTCGACVALLIGSELVAVGAPQITLAFLNEGAQKRELNYAVQDVFGNREQQVSLTLGTTFEGPAYLRADLFQIAGNLSMPLASDVHLRDVIFLHVIAQNLVFSVKLPDVKRPTEILVRVSLAPKDTHVSPLHLMDLPYKVFPASVTRELTDLLQPKPDGSIPAVIFGPGQNLRHFLTGLHVSFEDGGVGTPDKFDPTHLYFGELATDEQFQQAQDQSAGARMVLFSPDESLPEGVYAERSNSSVLVHVTSPLLDNLKDDPRDQLGLIKILHLLSAPLPSAN